MKMWFPLVMVLAAAAISTPLEAGIFDRLVTETEQSVVHNGGGGEVVHSPEFHAPGMVYGKHELGVGYPFKTSCCESQNACVGGLWKGYCSKAHGACDRMQSWFTKCARGHGKSGCDGGCKGGSKGGCATGNCGHGEVAFGKGHIQHHHVQRSPIQRSHVQRAPMKSHGPIQRGHIQRGHVQHGKSLSGCHTCGQSPCGCHGKGHHQKVFGGHHQKSFGKGKSCGGFGIAHATGNCGCAPAKHGKHHGRLGLFSRHHQCHSCGKSTHLGGHHGGCDCGAVTTKGWGHQDGIIWEDSKSMTIPHGQPTPANDPPVQLEIPTPTTDALPVPSTPTGHSASIRRLPPVSYQY